MNQIVPESAILKPRANIRKQRYFDKFLGKQIEAQGLNSENC
jgi:hypothetical protein